MIVARNAQSEHWAGQGGNAYHRRQKDIAQERTAFWNDIFSVVTTTKPERVLELGCGRGDNLDVFKRANWATAGLEINPAAAKEARRREHFVAVSDVIDDWRNMYWWEPTIIVTRGCLIHIRPSMLPLVFDRIHYSTAKMAVIAEYHAPTPTPVRYRGQAGLLWRGDFAGPLIERGWELLRTRFHSRYGPEKQDDLTTFVLKRSKAP